jgi:hypothetical protein
MASEQVINDLEAAREYAARGWHQFGWYAMAGVLPTRATSTAATTRCVRGCLAAAVGHDAPLVTDYTEAESIFCEANGITFGDIEAWNDAPERTKEQVLFALDRAIEFAKGRAR